MVPVVYSTPGVTLSTFSRCATAKMRCESFFRAASMARNVAGRPAPIGKDTPGNNTTSRSGNTGSVILSDIGRISLSGSCCISQAGISIVHAIAKRRIEHARSTRRRSIRQRLPNSHRTHGVGPSPWRVLPKSITACRLHARAGMGVVFNARDERLKRRVAVKVLPPDLAFREEIRLRFLREAETAARLSHPHIVPIHSVVEGPDGLVYFVMAYVDGESLGAKLKRRGRLPPDEARRIMLETADALGAAHAFGIIHRDVKPDNILLEGSRGRVVVTDFGIAKALSSTTGSATLTATGVAIGTPHYMSPEQAAGDREIDGRSDIYSLGVVSYQMLTGELPFQAPTVQGILKKHITERAPLVTEKCVDCPDNLAACVMRSLEKDPDDRWPTADAL